MCVTSKSLLVSAHQTMLSCMGFSLVGGLGVPTSWVLGGDRGLFVSTVASVCVCVCVEGSVVVWCLCVALAAYEEKCSLRCHIPALAICCVLRHAPECCLDHC